MLTHKYNSSFATKNNKTFQKITPYKWLRDLISHIDFAKRKVKPDGTTYIPHQNCNEAVLKAYRSGWWSKIVKLCNKDFDQHFTGLETYYFTAGSGVRVLICIDIDCHGVGTLAGAMAFAKFLSETQFPQLYYEPSTNGNGVHGYIIVETNGLRGSAFNGVMKQLESRLKEVAVGFDVSDVEIKGTMNEFVWGSTKGDLLAYRSGVPAKLPRDVARFSEWQQTTVVSVDSLRTKAPLMFSPDGENMLAPTVPDITRGKRSKLKAPCTTGSTNNHKFDLSYFDLGSIAEDLLQKFPADGVSTKNLAYTIGILDYLSEHLNTGDVRPEWKGTMPTHRVEALWNSLLKAGLIDRTWQPKVFAAIRRYLSSLGLIDWHDATFTHTTSAKWELAASFRLLLVQWRCDRRNKGKGKDSFIVTFPNPISEIRPYSSWINSLHQESPLLTVDVTYREPTPDLIIDHDEIGLLTESDYEVEAIPEPPVIFAEPDVSSYGLQLIDTILAERPRQYLTPEQWLAELELFDIHTEPPRLVPPNRLESPQMRFKVFGKGKKLLLLITGQPVSLL